MEDAIGQTSRKRDPCNKGLWTRLRLDNVHMKDDFGNTMIQLHEKTQWILEFAAKLESDSKFLTRMSGLEQIILNYTKSFDGKVVLGTMDAAPLFQASHEVLELYDIFKYVERFDNASSIRKQIRGILRANPDPLEDQTEDYGRDSEFELKVAVILSKAGWKITGFEDIEAEKNGIPICFQCKRPRNAGNLVQNLNRALNQLVRNNDVGGRCFGAAVINLDLIYETNKKHYFAKDDKLIHGDLQRIYDKFVFDCLPVVSRRDNPKLLGALGIITVLKWNPNSGSLLPIVQTIPCVKPGSKMIESTFLNLYNSMSGTWVYGSSESISDNSIKAIIEKTKS